jgi:hypothetical protein
VKGAWDDPHKGHDTKDGNAQSHSYDFANGAEGKRVRSARAGRVVFTHTTQSANTGDQQPDPPGSRGEGNLVVIRHLDGSAGAYAHLQKDQVFVEEGEYVPRGRVLALSGNVGHSFGPHIHFDVHPSFTDWNHWVPTMEIRFEDVLHKCWRPQAGDKLNSNNLVTSTPFGALLGPGTGAKSFLAGLEFDDFVAAWIDLGTTSPAQYMKTFDTYVENGTRRFTGLFGPGKAGQHFVAGLEFQPFVDTWIDLGKKKADMLAFDTYAEGGKQRFAGLFGPGQGGQAFVAGLEFQPFVDTWIDLGKKKCDMLSFRVYTEGKKTRFAGLFGPGKGGQAFIAGLEFQPFVDAWIDFGKKKCDMRTFHIYKEGGKILFAGLFGPGKGGQEFYAGISYDDLAAAWVKAKRQGRQLITLVAG